MKYVVMFLLLFISIYSSYSCSCDWQGSFLELSKKTDVVAKVKILGYENFFNHLEKDSIPLILVAEPITIFKGKLTNTKIRLAGDDGILCRVYANELEIGKEYYIQYDYEGMFGLQEISSCGEYFLEINDNEIISESISVLGTIQIFKTSISHFEKALKNKINNCINLSLSPNDNIVENQIKNGCLSEASTTKKVEIATVFIISLLIFLYIFRKRVFQKK